MSSPKPRVTESDPAFRAAVAESLKRYRDGENPYNRKLSDVEVATRLGVSNSAIGRYLRGKQVIGGELLARMLVELGTVVSYREQEISARESAPSMQRSKTADDQIVFVFDGPCELTESTENVSVFIARKQPVPSRFVIQIKVAG